MSEPRGYSIDIRVFRYEPGNPFDWDAGIAVDVFVVDDPSRWNEKCRKRKQRIYELTKELHELIMNRPDK